jgi:hypothetical protein
MQLAARAPTAAAAANTPAFIIICHDTEGAVIARDDDNLLTAVSHAALVESFASAPQSVFYVEVPRHRA